MFQIYNPIQDSANGSDRSNKESQFVPWNRSVMFRSKFVADSEPPGHWRSSRPLRFHDVGLLLGMDPVASEVLLLGS